MALGSSPGIQNSLTDKVPVAVSVSTHKPLTPDLILTINSNLTIATCIPYKAPLGASAFRILPNVKSGLPDSPTVLSSSALA